MSTSRYQFSGAQPGSLISEITQHFTPEVVRSAGSMIGESESSTAKALQVAAPTVLSGIANMASSPAGASDLTGMIREGSYAGLTDNPMSLFRGGSASSYLASAGQRHLGKIFGGNASSVTDLVAKSGGVSASSASKLMSLVAPLALGVLGRRASSQGSSGVTDLLSHQRDEISAAAPAGLSRILGLGPRPVPSAERTAEPEEVLDPPTRIEHFAEATPVVEQPAVSTVRPRVEAPLPLERRTVPLQREGGGLRWLPFALLLLAVIGLLGWLLSRARAPRIGNVATRGIPAATSALTGIHLPNGASLSVPQGSINYQLASFLGNTSAAVPRTFVFDNLNFESASTQLTPDSGKTVNDLSQILKAYPNAQVQLSGHTDNTGDPQSNRNLSLDRANAIRTMLLGDGIAANRVSTQGFGQDRPIASNGSEEGRAQNRRTELTVTQK